VLAGLLLPVGLGAVCPCESADIEKVNVAMAAETWVRCCKSRRFIVVSSIKWNSPE
jgi:hypothetical protein